MAGPKSRYPADFNNAKRSKYSEGAAAETGYSSAVPDSYERDEYKYQKTGKMGSVPEIKGGAEGEPSRQNRLGKSQTPSGPKSRMNYSEQSPGFLKHTIKGKC